MAAPAQSGNPAAQPIWVWKTVGEEPFAHPSDIPVDDQALAKARFVEKLRGPRLTKITAATLLQIGSKGKENVALIAENGATRELPKTNVLPWYEGLLLLEELEVGSQTSWLDDKLRECLEQERNKFQKKQVSSALYIEKRLISTAVTGRRFVDAGGKEWLYRRENILNTDKNEVPAGVDADGFFRVQEIVGYLPPWEAFCHEQCGFYQDFYEVKWDFPFSEIDYANVENGSKDHKGATWEPDECLPAHLDGMRIAAKTAWIRKRKEQEQLRDEKARAAQAAAKADGSRDGKTLDKTRQTLEKVPSSAKPPDKEQPPKKKARLRRDGDPLDRDVVRSSQGHDFAPAEDAEKNFGGIQSAWPKRPEDYPSGYGVASPPGFCWDNCNCMDDQRPQHHWETNKAWLEERTRSSSSLQSIDHLTAQTSFVRKRGSVSRMFYFETLGNSAASARAPHSRSALDLAESLEKALKATVKTIPVHALLNRIAPVKVPAKAFLRPALDYDPLKFHARLAGGRELPSWLTCSADDGALIASESMPDLIEPLELRISLAHAEGIVGEAECGITPEHLRGSTSPWAKATVAIVQLFKDGGRCKLEKGYMDVLWEHLAEVYDFSKLSVRDVALGEWLEVVCRILCMLRATAVANVALGNAHKGSGSWGV